MPGESQVSKILETLSNPSNVYLTKDKYNNEAHCYIKNDIDPPLIVIFRKGIITSYQPEKNYLKNIKKGEKLYGNDKEGKVDN
ncbi:MAG: hypothetical protein E7A81_00405 [Clostridiales bacterium]|nr:hypothetical protein [Clostridiales bacterium]MDU1041621.1 hypothetical protein [Clostridiales bacterium]